MRVKFQKVSTPPAKTAKTPKIVTEKPIDASPKQIKSRFAVFVPKVNDLVLDSIKYLPRNAKVLDLGCGEWANALFLARKGFDVVAIDILKPSIDKLKENAEKEGLKIEAIVGNIETYLKGCKEFDAIFGINVLQFVKSKIIFTVITDIKRKTAPKGLNIVASFISKDRAQKSVIIAKGWYIFYKNELATLYKEQTMHLYQEKITNIKARDKSLRKKFIVKMISQKK